MKCWAVEFLEQMIQAQSFLAHRLEHVVPHTICTHSVTLLAQMYTVDCHDRQVGLCIVLIENTRVFEERLVDDGEIVRVKLRHEAHAFHNLNESSLKLSEQLAVSRKLLPKYA